METFSLLKYWRDEDSTVSSRAIVSTIAHSDTDTDDEDEDGPFFDLEFGVNEDGGSGDNGSDLGVMEVEDDEAASDSDGDFDFTLSSVSESSSDDGNSDVNLPLSSDDDLFFKGQVLPVVESDRGDPDSKPQFPVSLMKSATKFRAFMLGLKKPKVEKPPPEEKEVAAENEKFFAVKFKVEETSIKSLFTREISTRRFHHHSLKRTPSEEAQGASDDKLFSKEAVQRYLKKVKPLYVRVSRRYSEKLRLSSQVTPSATKKSLPEIEAAKDTDLAVLTSPRVQKPMNLPMGRLREVCKHLGKSRSASSAAVAAVPGGSRRDDSPLEQQDGIQGAILHCKRSFNASRDSESSMFIRSVSDLLQDTSSNLPPATSSDEDRN